MRQPFSNISRRQLLALSGSGMAMAIAGCSSNDNDQDGSDGSDNNTPEGDGGRREEFRADEAEVVDNQEYEIPPVKRLHPHDRTSESPHPTEGVASIVFEDTVDFYIQDIVDTDASGYTKNPPERQFADELTFELFVYDTYPVGNEIELTKVGEKTTGIGVWNDSMYNEDGELKGVNGTEFNELTSPIETNPINRPEGVFEVTKKHVYFTYDPSLVPKNEQVRFRLRITNNRTGTQEWAMDEQMIYYVQYNDESLLYNRIAPIPKRENDPSKYESYSGFESVDLPPFNPATEKEDKFEYIQRSELMFPTEIHNELPYSREADYIESWDEMEQREYTPEYKASDWDFFKDFIIRGNSIDIPKEHVDYAEGLYVDQATIWRDDIYIKEDLPSDVEYHGRDEYNTLDNPLLHEMADNIDTALDNYGVNNHFARINAAADEIRQMEYDSEQFKGNEQALMPPELYFSQGGQADCLNHTMNLSWLLYHLGYPVAGVYLHLGGRELHTGPAVGLPESVIRNDFPEWLSGAIFSELGSNFEPVENIGITPNGKYVLTLEEPESTGDLVWLYIEATARPYDPLNNDYVIGRGGNWSPEERGIEWVLEPEDSLFDTGIDKTYPQ